MVGRELAGMLIMGVAALFSAAMLILSTLAKRMRLPYYLMLGSGMAFDALVLFVWLCKTGEMKRLEADKIKWVFIRGLFGTALFSFALLAAAAGAPLGDVSALQSINVVVAALMGRAFLGEPLRRMHWAALLSGLVGAMLVSKPETLFSGSAADKPLLGYFFAILSGFTGGTMFIAARKSQGVNPWIMTMSVLAQEGIVLPLLPHAGVVTDPAMDILVDEPLKAVAIMAVFALLAVGTSLSLSAGAQMCPASASSTIFNSVGMTLNYTAQTVFHHDAPDAITLVGAASMVLAVMVMAYARSLESATAGKVSDLGTTSEGHLRSAPAEPAATDAQEGCGEDAGANDDDDEVTSLASFVASEFSGCSLSPQKRSARQRRGLAAVLPPATTVGVASA